MRRSNWKGENSESGRKAAGIGVHNDLPIESRTFSERIQAKLLGLMVSLIGVGLALLLIILGFTYLQDRELGRRLVSIEPASMAIRITQARHFFGNSIVETDLAFFVLRQGISIHKNSALTLETYVNGDKYLCGLEDGCAALSRPFLAVEPAQPDSATAPTLPVN